MVLRFKAPALARHTIGITLVAITVFLWTASNFLISNILADDSYSKPYLITYINTAFFSLFLLFVGLKHLVRQYLQQRRSASPVSRSTAEGNEEASAALLHYDALEDDVTIVEEPDEARMSSSQVFVSLPGQLTLRETGYLAFEFCLLWFFANFTLSVALEYTTVASSTVLTATSGMFTLLFGVWAKIERFTLLKLCGVIISMTGITMISLMDVSADGDKHRGTFPHKSPAKIALGDVLALSSAILYGFYSVLMKKRIGSEDRVDMLMFFGMVGLINTLILWPGIIFLHLVGLEPLELPVDQRVYSVIALNSVVSVFADLCWAYAVVLTSPLVVTVGLSMSIPLAMFGQAVIHSSSAPVVYWIGAVFVFFAFGLINHESKPSNEDLSGSRARLVDP